MEDYDIPELVPFEGGRFRNSGEPKVSIRNNSTIAFNRPLLEKYSFTDRKYVQMNYGENKDFYFIGFSFTDGDVKGRLKIHKPKSVATITSVSFFKLNNLNVEKISGKYDAERKVLPNIGEVILIKIPKNKSDHTHQ